MKYPVPIVPIIFLRGENSSPYPLPQGLKKINQNFSWNQKNPFMDDFLQEIHRHKKLYLQIPFVELIFLCNSISFNALHKDSDIDLFIVSKNQRIWTARFFASLLFYVNRVKRSDKKKCKKFCLSFFVSRESANLNFLSLGPQDVYFHYRIAHLILLYESYHGLSQEFFGENSWIKDTLLVDEVKQYYHIGNHVFVGRSVFKRFFEGIFSGYLGDFFEWIIKCIRSLIIQRKNRKDVERNKDVLITDQVLKFHKDIRKDIMTSYRG